MRNYTTQMEAARKGMITPEMKQVAKKEYRTEEEIRELVAKGQVAICANRLQTVGTKRSGLHAPYENQCEFGRFQGL